MEGIKKDIWKEPIIAFAVCKMYDGDSEYITTKYIKADIYIQGTDCFPEGSSLGGKSYKETVLSVIPAPPETYGVSCLFLKGKTDRGPVRELGIQWPSKEGYQRDWGEIADELLESDEALKRDLMDKI